MGGKLATPVESGALYRRRDAVDRHGTGRLLGLYGLAMAAVLLAAHWLAGADYVGPDNDDVMRLVEVRDFLNGQSWFDMTQYRLGLEGGVLMHWSRLIDLPIALLIRLFGTVAPQARAEALALTAWPLFLSFTIVVLMGLAGFRLAGRAALHAAACLAILFVFGMGRFSPGSIDHHNAQLTLAALLLAMLLDPAKRPSNFAVAGLAAAAGLAVGAEAVPFVAIACATVALRWAWHGAGMARQARAFSLAFILTVSLAYVLTTPPSLYRMVTCDNLSLGFYALASVGGFLLFSASLLLSQARAGIRYGALAVTGAAVFATARIIAPQCLGNPLSTLDPMLTELWLNKVMEANSVIAEFRLQPGLAPGFYAAGVLGLAVLLVQAARRERTESHLVIAACLAATLGVALVQVRGAMYSNLIAILPLAVMLADLRAWQRQSPDSFGRAGLLFLAGTASVPLLWSVGGLAVTTGFSGLAAQMAPGAAVGAAGCSSRQALAPLATLPAGVVMAPSDVGAHILRFTPHRVLSAPYHRNQGGMLTELNTGLAMPEEAIALLRGAHVDYLVFCPSEMQTRDLARLKPEGLYGTLMAGRIPPYLKPLTTRGAGVMTIFRVAP